MTCRTESSGSCLYVQTEFVQAFEGSYCFCADSSKDAERVWRKIGLNNDRNLLFISMDGTERIMKYRAVRDYRFLRLKDYNVVKQILDRKLSEQAVILKAMTVLLKYLEKKLTFSGKQKRRL